MNTLRAVKLAIILAGGLAAVPSMPAFAAETAKTRTIRIAIYDEAGKPVRGAEAALLQDYVRKPFRFKAVADGVAEFKVPARDKEGWGQSLDRAIVRAPGKAPAVAKFADTGDADTSVTLKTGHEVELEIVTAEGKPLPADATIQLFNAELAPPAFNSLNPLGENRDRPGDERVHFARVESAGKGKFKVRIADDFGDAYAIIDHPGVIRWHWVGPLGFGERDAKVRLELPIPATLKVSFDTSSMIGAGHTTTFTLQRTQEMPGLGLYADDVESVVVGGNAASAEFRNLSPAGHSYSAKGASGLVEAYEDGKQLKAGLVESVKLAARPFIPVLRVRDAEASRPVAGARCVLKYLSEEYGGYMSDWATADGEGLIRVLPSRVHHANKSMARARGKYAALVQAPGYGAAAVEFTAPAQEPELVVGLTKGTRVEIEVKPPEGAGLPADFVPFVFPPNATPPMWRQRHAMVAGDNAEAGFLDTESLGGGRYAVRVGPGIDELKVAVDLPDVVTAYESRAFTADDWSTGPLVVELPKPGGVEVRVDASGMGVDAAQLDKYDLNLSLYAGHGPIRIRPAASASGKVAAVSLARWGLAPGEYKATAYARDTKSKKMLMAQAEETLTVEAGTTRSVVLKLGAPRDSGPTAHELELPPLRVTDAAGRPVAGATVWARAAGDDMNYRKADDLGGGRYSAKMFRNIGRKATADDATATYEYLVTAPGHAASAVAFDMPTSRTEIAAALSKGRRVELTVTAAGGRAVPDSLMPLVYDEKSAVPVWVGIQADRSNLAGFSAAGVEKTGAGRYAFHVAEETSGVFVLLNESGFIRGLVAGPFGAEELAKGALKIEVPQPWTLEVSFGPGDRKPDYEGSWVELTRSATLPGNRNWSFRIAKAENDGTSVTGVFDDLAPAGAKAYSAEAGTGSYERRNYSNEGAYSDRKSADFTSATRVALAIPYEPFDESMLKGEEVARVTVKGLDGKPAVGKGYKVTSYDRRYGMKTLAEGTIPESGIVEIKGLPYGAPDKPTSASEVFGEGRKAQSLDFRVADADLGNIQFWDRDGKGETVTPWPKGKPRDFEFTLPPVVGDIAPDIELAEVFGDGKVRLADLRGKVVFIDFWATWCGPCQDPMAELNRVAKARAEGWKDKVALIGASIDDERETVQKHLRKNDWLSPRQLWCASAGEDKQGWQAPAAKTYGIRGVPTALLIDKDGKITWRGHPSGFDKDAEIGKLLK